MQHASLLIEKNQIRLSRRVKYREQRLGIVFVNYMRNTLFTQECQLLTGEYKVRNEEQVDLANLESTYRHSLVVIVLGDFDFNRPVKVVRMATHRD